MTEDFTKQKNSGKVNKHGIKFVSKLPFMKDADAEIRKRKQEALEESCNSEMSLPEELIQNLANSLNLSSVDGKEWRGKNPIEPGATENGFSLFRDGSSFDMKLGKRYTFNDLAIHLISIND